MHATRDGAAHPGAKHASLIRWYLVQRLTICGARIKGCRRCLELEASAVVGCKAWRPASKHTVIVREFVLKTEVIAPHLAFRETQISIALIADIYK